MSSCDFLFVFRVVDIFVEEIVKIPSVAGLKMLVLVLFNRSWPGDVGAGEGGGLGGVSGTDLG